MNLCSTVPNAEPNNDSVGRGPGISAMATDPTRIEHGNLNSGYFRSVGNSDVGVRGRVNREVQTVN